MRTLVSILAIIALTLSAGAQGPYRITHTYTLGGEGGWDYVIPDPPLHRVFIARENRFMVIDENNGKLLGELCGFQRAHGVVLVESAHHGFATSGQRG